MAFNEGSRYLKYEYKICIAAVFNTHLQIVRRQGTRETVQFSTVPEDLILQYCAAAVIKKPPEIDLDSLKQMYANSGKKE